MNQTRDVRLLKVNNADPAPQPYYGQSWALVIGIDRYKDASARLANARNDAASIADLLTTVYSFDHVHRLYDEEATKDTILAWLRDKLPAEVQHNDRLVIFFAGHGTTRESSSGQKRGYLIPYDAQFGRFADYVDMSELRDACGWIPAKHILIILDCCFSGIAAVTARATPTSAALGKLTENYIRRITERGAWQVLTAGALDELVADSGSRPGHSAFTSALLAGLHGAADQNEDGVITASDLAAFVKPEVSRETTQSGGKGQIPFFSYFAGSDQGDFVLIKPGDTPMLADPPLREKILLPANPFWTWGIVAAVVVLLGLMGWLVWSGQRANTQLNAQLTSILGTITAQAIAFSTQQQATIDAVQDAPQSTQEAVIAEQNAFAAGTSTAVAALLVTRGFAVPDEPTATPTLALAPVQQQVPIDQSSIERVTRTPTPTTRSAQPQLQVPAEQSVSKVTVTPALRSTPTSTPTPDLSQQSGPVSQVAITPESQIGESVSQVALVAGTERTNPTECATYLYIPAGDFEMGPDERDQSGGAQHTVFVDAFWIGQTEVTNLQYAQCVEASGCKSPANERLNDANFANHPVTNVTWDQANDYARWAGGRLPSEAEWEKAACGKKAGKFPWGDQEPDRTLLNFDGTQIGDTAKVGSFPAGASPFGALDMAGNVAEWTSTLYQLYPYQIDDGREDPNVAGARVTRGGSFLSDAYSALCSTRASADSGSQSKEIGFRVVIADESILTDATECSQP